MNGSAFDDPFEGEDALWAPEDWSDASTQEGSQRFFRGLILAAAFSAVVWLAIASAAVFAYRSLT